MARPMPGWLANWLERHQHPVSRWLHYVGIPLTILACVVAGFQLHAWRWDLWWRPVVLLGVGYLLQWVGHLLEGNDMGEVILVKKALGRPYVAVSPRYRADAAK
ncbi:MAG: DUF962 domain-containing protein [Phycisphaerales bacterium]|nr:DUF962 domain-containing protein [Phycisphaerales bacterium]